MRNRGDPHLWATILLLLVPPTHTAWAQGTVDRTPNLDDGWTIRPGVIQFNFLHRFEVSPPPFRKVTSFPNFHFATGLPWKFNVGLDYATNSTVFTGIPNEYQVSLRRPVLRQGVGEVVDLGVVGAYNFAPQSVDGELEVARRLGRVRLLGTVRGFTDGYDTQRSYWGLGGGAVVRITSWLSLAGDVFDLVNADDSLSHTAAWGAAAQLRIPYSPHTVSFQVTNTQSGSLEGSSRGIRGAHMAGFEFTIPFTLARYFGRKAAPATARPPAAPLAAPSAAPVVHIANLAFVGGALRVRAGTRVRWVNEDQVPHSVTANDGSFDSGLIEPSQSFEHAFDHAGTFAYHCTPHPFMRGVVLVTAE
jgi:plastocyanin